MAASDTLKKVLRLKLKLKESTELNTVLKTLRKLQELDITLDILAESGIGKTVNSFRKRKDAGDVAKLLVNKWKKLVPKESTNAVQNGDAFGKEKYKTKETSRKEEEIKHQGIPQKPDPSDDDAFWNSDAEIKVSKRTQETASRQDSRNNSGSNKHDHSHKSVKDLTLKLNQTFGSKQEANKCKSEAAQRGKMCLGMNAKEAKTQLKDKRTEKVKPVCLGSGKNKNGEERMEFCNEERRSGRDRGGKRDCRESMGMSVTSKQSDEGLDTPSASFEACLNYDLKAAKRKKKTCEVKKPKRAKVSDERPTCAAEVMGRLTGCVAEQQPEKASSGSVLDLLNVPLPASLPAFEDLSSFSYFEKKPEIEVLNVQEEVPVFTGQRLNRKMQVYSGSKITYLPTMMTLYQQCIRTLQNNIDLLCEVGGVPFDILEPVLERCTPDQLLRIEECNPAYVGASDHLWERHCQRDFRNDELQEYESWREMHLRLSQEREKKLRRLTKSIVSAHSGKPKGRQVKLAYINSVAKPPRDVRIQQEIHGTAGPLPVPYATDKASFRLPDGKSRPSVNEFTRAPNPNQGQDPRKVRRVAPMMAKSLRAFKKQISRR